MGLNFNKFSINSQRWKNAISTIRICLIFFKFYNNGGNWQSKAKSLFFPTTQELFLYVKYWMPYSTPKFDYHFFDTPCITSLLEFM